MKKLPHCDELFERYFDRWYDDEWRRWKGVSHTRPDMLEDSKLVGKTGADASPLDALGQSEAAELIRSMYESAQSDWQEFLEVTPPVDLDWVDEFDQYFDRGAIARLIDDSDPEDFGNVYVVTCCELGSVLGEMLLDQCSTLFWLYAWPYWESSLLHPPTGSVVPVFHWAIKKMSEYGVDDGLAAKIDACCELLDGRM
jgi:hypothetical protein